MEYEHHEEPDHDYPVLQDITGIFDEPAGVIYYIGCILLMIGVIACIILFK